jgi:hypothetical protein
MAKPLPFAPSHLMTLPTPSGCRAESVTAETVAPEGVVS